MLLRERFWLILRGTIIILLLLALISFALTKRIRDLNVIFCLDCSESIPKEEYNRALDFIKEALGKKGESSAGLVAFATDAFLEEMPRVDIRIEAIRSKPDGRYTDLGKAIDLASSCFTRLSSKRIVLLTDGQENRGDLLSAVRRTRLNQIEVDVFPLSFPSKDEALLEELLLPSEANLNEAFIIKAIITSSRGNRARVRLFRNGEYLGEDSLKLEQGKNILSFTDILRREGFYLYEAYLEPQYDTILENNRALGFVAVRGRPKVLYLEENLEEAVNLANVLQAQEIGVKVIKPQELPPSLVGLQNYGAIILGNVMATQLTGEQMRVIQSYVRDLGGGLVMLGGERSFRAGLYGQTPIEEALPVQMDIRERLSLPKVSLILIIDRSASMSTIENKVRKIELAKEAAQSVAEFLDEKDELGVVAFDTAYEWVVPLQMVKDKEEMLRLIASINAGGGTDMFPPLVEALRTLSSNKAQLKHIIVLSDGQTSPNDFEGITKRMVKEGITLSAVAIGKDADLQLMSNLSKWGKGRFYYTQDVHSLPRIFVTEAQIASRALIVEEPFVPLVKIPHEVLRGIDWRATPPLLGYVVTSPKATAEVPLISPTGDPLLALWRYGLGKAVAFTSDAKGKWGTFWLPWKGFNRLWPQIIRWVLKRESNLNLDISISLTGSEAHFKVDALDKDGHYLNLLDSEVGIAVPGGRESTLVKLKQTAPGRYEGSFSLKEVGTYLLAFALKKGGETIDLKVRALAIPYPPEYKNLGLNESLLSKIVDLGKGRFLSSPEEAFRPPRRENEERQELWRELLIASLFLFLLDIALRRTPFIELVREKMAVLREKFSKRLKETRRGRDRGIKEDLSYEELEKLIIKGESFKRSSDDTTKAYQSRLYLARKKEKRF